MMKHFAGRFAVMVLTAMIFLGSGNGKLERAGGLGFRDGVSVSGLIAGLSGAILSPAMAEAAVVKAPAKKKAASSRPAAASKKTKAKKTKKTKHAKSDCCGQGGQGGKSRGKGSGKRCEPQSLTYARQRSGNMSSRNGKENGPLTWFASEKKIGRTTDEPTAGSVLILGAQGHGMPTGHVAYVEEVFPESPSTYRVVFSHTNYDRRCHLETDIEALYNRATMTLDVRSGAWRGWGRGLKVAGFIRDN